MKLKFLATGQAPSVYSIQGEVITVGEESFDLSVLEHGDKFEGVEPETLDLPGSQVIRDAHRDDQGELHVTLCQQSPTMGHWRESEVMEAEDYVPGRVYIRQLVNGVLKAAPNYEEVDLEYQDQEEG